MPVGAAWLCGTVAMQQLPELPGPIWSVPLLLAVLVTLRYDRLRPLLAFAAAAAWTCWCAGERLAERLPADALGTDFALVGSVGGFPSVAPEQITFPFNVAEPRPPGVPPRVRLTWYGPPATIEPGDVLALTARLRPPRSARNPGGFDYELWLHVNGYGATGYVREAVVGTNASRSVTTVWLEFRAELARRIGAASTDTDGVALSTALALGERFRFTEQHWADFRRTGTSHLVAVSGMHVALLGLVVFVALRFAWLRLPAPLASYDLEAAAGASLLATCYYAALTGFAVPAQRSLVMIAIALAALVSRRRFDAAQLVAATLVVVLVWDPFAPLSASFWLSFVAVAILLLLAAPRRRHAAPGGLRRDARVVLEFVRLQWWIGLALLPLTAWYFGEVSIVGPLVNLVAIPFFNLCLVPLTVLTTLALSFDALVEPAALLVRATVYLAGCSVRSLHTIAEVPAAAFALPSPPWPVFAAAAFGVGFAVGGAALPGCRLAWLALLPLVMPALELPPHGSARVVVLDVGHGLAMLVETHAHRLLFDAGPTARSGFDSGEQIVLPALAASGRRGLDRLIVSHADNDHAGGAAAIVAAFRSVEVIKGPDVVKPPGRVCMRGDEWSWDGVRFTILHPGADFGARGNESSCVLKIEAGASSLLVAGDIERRGENALLAQSVPLAADVVVVPHHGSATSSSPSFVAAVGAKHAIVSAGYANRWGFPRPEVRERWEQSGAEVTVTGDSGAVSVTLTPAGIAVAAERDGRHRYWQEPRFAW